MGRVFDSSEVDRYPLPDEQLCPMNLPHWALCGAALGSISRYQEEGARHAGAQRLALLRTPVLNEFTNHGEELAKAEAGVALSENVTADHSVSK